MAHMGGVTIDTTRLHHEERRAGRAVATGVHQGDPGGAR